MGSSYWSNDAYADRAAWKAARGMPTFGHDTAVRAGVVGAGVAERLDPRKMHVVGGRKLRESRDSASHPNSNAVIVCLDETGSMGAVVHAIHKSLPKLMTILTSKGYLADPQILFSAVGDAWNHEAAPLQVGQFESGIEMEDDLSSILIEGKGGGQNRETYELMAYVGAYHTSTDCLEKRGHKGYCFIIGDELPYPKVSRLQVHELVGVALEDDIPTPMVFERLRDQFNVFYVLPKGASNGSNPSVIKHWRGLVGEENVIELDDPHAAAEVIALQIGLCEGTTDVDAAPLELADAGSSTSLVRAATSAIHDSYKRGGTIMRLPPGTLAPKGIDRVERI